MLHERACDIVPVGDLVPSKLELEAKLYGGAITIRRGDYGRKKHVYRWVEKGLFIPGVTTILGILDKPALLPWAAKMAGEYVKANLPDGATREQINSVSESAKTEYNKIKEAAGDIGTQVHAVAEALFQGQPIEMPTNPLAINGIRALQEWLAANDVKPIDCEKIVFSKSAFFAGTMDLLCALNGKLTQVDIKSGSGIYNEHYFQTGAYNFAWEEEHDEEIEQIAIVNTNKKTGIPKIKLITDRNEIQFYINTFLRVKSVSDNLKRMDGYGNGLQQ